MFASISDTHCFCQCIPLLSRFGNTWLLYIFHMHTQMALILRAGARARWQILHCLQTQTSPSVSPDNAYEVDFTLGRLIPASRPDASRRDAKHTRGMHMYTFINIFIIITYSMYFCPTHTWMHLYTRARKRPAVLLRLFIYTHTPTCLICIHYLCIYTIMGHTYELTQNIYLSTQIYAVLLYTHAHSIIYLYSVSCQRLQTHTYMCI